MDRYRQSDRQKINTKFIHPIFLCFFGQTLVFSFLSSSFFLPIYDVSPTLVVLLLLVVASQLPSSSLAYPFLFFLFFCLFLTTCYCIILFFLLYHSFIHHRTRAAGGGGTRKERRRGWRMAGKEVVTVYMNSYLSIASYLSIYLSQKAGLIILKKRKLTYLRFFIIYLPTYLCKHLSPSSFYLSIFLSSSF